MTQQDLDALKTEVLRMMDSKRYSQDFMTSDGSVRGVTETDLISHLTSKRNFEQGRQYRFPGIAADWGFETKLNSVGFKLIPGRNQRGNNCRVVTQI